MICSKCNSKNNEGVKYCNQCGSVLPEQDEFDSGMKSAIGTMSGMITSMAPKDIESSLRKGSIFAARYEILNDGFKGGMGIVFKVRDNMLRDIKALKLILPAYLENEKAVSRFKQEVATTQKLLHKNIIRVFDIGEFEGALYFTMEWIDGISMRDYIIERKKQNHLLSIDEVKNLIGQLCSALSYAHREFSIIHRDIKPENILMIDPYTKYPKIKIADFGIAKADSQAIHHSVSSYMGTPIYMAPEQYTDASNIDKRADIYSVGAILYELLTFMHPLGTFQMPTEVNPSLPKRVDEIIRKSLSADKSKRYEDVLDIVKSLDVSGDEEPIPNPPPGHPPAVKKSLMPVIAVVIVLIVVGVGYKFIAQNKTSVEPSSSPSPIRSGPGWESGHSNGNGVIKHAVRQEEPKAQQPESLRARTTPAPSAKATQSHAAIEKPARSPDLPHAQINDLIEEGETLYKQGKYPECIRKMKEALQIDSGNSKAQFYIRQANNKLDNIRKLSDPSSGTSNRY